MTGEPTRIPADRAQAGPREGQGRGNPDIGKQMAQHPARASGGFKLSEQVLGKIVEFISAGNYYSVAARTQGISESTLMKWRKRGEMVIIMLVKEFGEDGAEAYDMDSDNPFDENDCSANDWMCFRLVYGINKADAEAEASAVLSVRAHWGSNWQSAMTYLERKHPDRWKRRDLHEVAAVDKAARRNEEAMLSIEAQERMEEALMIQAGKADVDSTAEELD